MSMKSVKAVRKLERPRPLRLGSDQEKSSAAVLSPTDGVLQQNEPSDQEVLNELESLHICVNNGNYDTSMLSHIVRVCHLLKTRGPAMENAFRDQLDCYFVALRNACRDERLAVQGRLRLLEVIELRSMGWKANENLNEYYRCKLQEIENYDYNPLCNSTSSHHLSLHPSVSPPLSLQPSEVVKSSGKFGKPAKIPGRNFLKDEVVIRNADSGKVMGIKGRRVHMIEELSDTVISFQRVNPGAQNRAVQITGPSEENISHAKVLIEDTIRRNASPVRDVMEEPVSGYSSATKESSMGQKRSLVHSYSTGDATMLGDYTATVLLGKNYITLSSTEESVVRTAKMILERQVADKDSAFCQLMRASYSSPEPNILSNSGNPSDLNREQPLWQGLNSQSVQQWSGPPSSHTSSSSDDETFRDNHEDFTSVHRNTSATLKPLVKSNSVVKNLPAQLGTSNGTCPAELQHALLKPSEILSISSDAPAKQQQQQQPSDCIPVAQPLLPAEAPETSLPVGNPRIRSYARDFLLDCAQSPHSTELPPDFPSLDAEVANIMVRQNRAMFDPDGFRQRMMRQGSMSEFVSATSPVSSTPPQSELSEVDEGNAV